MDRHTLALMSIIGSVLDVLGALYLAYDLLGGEHGPLRTLTRAVTYGIIFGTGYGLFLGPVFGVSSGIAHGITLGWEFSRASRRGDVETRHPIRRPGFWMDTAMSGIRGCGFGLGAAWLFGAQFGIAFALFSTVGQSVAYRIGIRPTIDYKPSIRPRVTRFQLLAAANRTVGYAAAGFLSSLFARENEHAMAVGLKVGLAIGLVTALSTPFTPSLEWMADHVPEKRMGVVGIGLILIGFTLQSVQYWVTLLNVPLH